MTGMPAEGPINGPLPGEHVKASQILEVGRCIEGGQRSVPL